MMDKRLFALVPGALRHVLLTVLWQFAGLAANVCFVWGISRVLAALVEGTAVPPAYCAALIFLGICGRALAARMAQRSAFEASADVKRIVRCRIYEKLLRIGPHYADDIATAEVVQLSVEGCEQLETYFGQYLPQLFYAVLAPTALFIVVAPICLPAAVVLLACVPLIPAVIVLIQKIAKRILAAYWDQYAALGDTFLENLQGLSTLKIYAADAARHEQMDREAERFRTVTMAVLSMQLNSIIVMDIVALGGAAAGISVALLAAAHGAVTLFGALLIALLSADFFIPMRQLGSYFHVAMNGIAAADKIFRLLELPEPAKRTALPEAGAHFSMHGAGFSYDGERAVLRAVDLDVPAVGLTAVVGESGSGKSTIAALLSGAETGYMGQVLLGEQQVRALDPASLAHYLTTVGSASFLFAGTVRDNLKLAAPHADDEELWSVLEAAALADYLRAQEGLDTRLEARAANLSGGQRQRLALARALLADSPAYIFDEATSNIDVESEERIMAILRDLARRKAVLVISHRLANVVDAQCIYVLEKGGVAGAGTHDELLSSCQAYRDLWTAQRELERFGEVRHGAL
ncbi:ABC transporter ATP-binding protein/permease [Coriobacteriales bacterium OH1046]|nr:ABC transporter ATP-binding protein/permease [Coriobacteriales bacterium OH1046]